MHPAAIDLPVIDTSMPTQRVEPPAATQTNKKIRRAAGVASFNGWTIGIAAVLSAPFAFFSLLGCFIFVGLAVVAYNEFRGRRRILRGDPAGANHLGWNQVGLLALICVYCGWAMYDSLTSPSPLMAELTANPDLATVLGPDFYQQFVVGFYGVVIIISVIFQGANAIYYFTRRKYVVA